MIGDRPHDIQAGKGNGFCTIGVLWGNGTKEELLAAGADYLVKNLRELVGVIEFLNQSPEFEAEDNTGNGNVDDADDDAHDDAHDDADE